MSPPVVTGDGKIAVLAFGTLGDVLPIAVVVAELAKNKRNCAVTFITHSAHEFLRRPLALAGVSFHPVSTAPVSLPPDKVAQDCSPLQFSEMGSPTAAAFPEGSWKVHLEQKHRKECLLAVDQEGWHLAELYRVPCAVAAPYVVPYSAPASFEREFRAMQPMLYKRLQCSQPGEIGWGEVLHWMWPLFTDRWTEWRLNSLHLSACPLNDPVTELPMSQNWPQAPPLLYGFSQEVVECPAYWPSSIHVCGFWYAPPEWEAMYGQPWSAEVSDNTMDDHTKNSAAETTSSPAQCKLLDFLAQDADLEHLPIFIGLSSIGSMGYLRSPETFLKVVLAVLEATGWRALLFTASYQPLDAVVMAAANNTELPLRNLEIDHGRFEDLSLLKDGIILGNNRLFCFSGFLAYNWLFPNCSMVMHHGGSGTTAAALRSGVPQIICPFVLDQFYWAERMAWIGVAPQPLKLDHLFPADGDKEFLEAVGTLVNAVTDASRTEMRTRAVALSQQIHQEDGVGKFIQIFSEQLQC